MKKNLGGAPRQPHSLRSQIRVALLDLFSKGSHGDVAEVQAKLRSYRRNRYKREAQDAVTPVVLKIQIAQVRNELLDKIGVSRQSGAGRLTKERISRLQLRLKSRTAKTKIDRMMAAVA